MPRDLMSLTCLGHGWRHPVIVLMAGLMIAGGLHLVAPNRATHRYHAGAYWFNADSAAYARAVVRFPAGLNDCEQGRARLSRPLYPFLGWLVYQPLRPWAGWVPTGVAQRVSQVMQKANHPEIWDGVDPRSVVLAWVALVAVNVGLYLASMILTLRALGEVFEAGLATALALLVAGHSNTIEFVFVPSSEPFNALIPALFLNEALRRWPRSASGRLSALGLGILMLGKGLAFPFLNWLADAWKREGRWREMVLRSLMLTAPFAGYRILLAALGVSWYSAETEAYRQFVWMVDDARADLWLEIPMRWLAGGGEFLALSMQIGRAHV